MKTLLYIVTFYISSFAPTHDVAMAIFHISESGSEIKMEITFDLVDLAHSIKTTPKELNEKSIKYYLDENTEFRFNNQILAFKISKTRVIGDHIKVNCEFEKEPKNVNSIKIINTCLNDISNHSNVIQVDINAQSKDYRMHEKRTEIELEY